MAEENKVGVSDQGLFDFTGKKEEKEEKVVVTGVEKIHVVENEKIKEKKESVLDKLHDRFHSSSSSSDEEEEGVEGENKEKKKKKKNKGLKEKIKEKMSGDKKEDVATTEQDMVVTAAPAVGEHEDTSVVIERVEKVEAVTKEEGKKGFLEKIKEKLPGHYKKEMEEAEEGQDGKKGIFGKIMDKLPGYHKEEMDNNTPPPGH